MEDKSSLSEQLISKNLTGLLIIFVVAFFVYKDVGSFEFSKDDFFSIIPIPGITELSTIPSFFTSPVQFYVYETETLHNLHYYRPIATSTLTLDFVLFGTNNAGWLHLENLFLHIINSYILFLIFTCLVDRKTSLLCAVSYSIFPHFTETVSIYHYRVDLLVTFFIFQTLLVTVRKEGAEWKYYASAFFFLAMLTKEIAIILVVLIPFFRHYRFKELHGREILFVFLWPMILYWSLRYNALGNFIRPENNYYNLDNFAELNVNFYEKIKIIVDSFAVRFYWVFSPFEIPSRVLVVLTQQSFFVSGTILLSLFTLLSFHYFRSKSIVSLLSLSILTSWFPLSSILVAVPDALSARLFYYPAPWIILLLFVLL
ncbi:MAG: hypothetical protein HQK84_12550, partial [Nitrospinae bacterium]|nr:hypothetical protein [Nitrospinota bacterium]